MKVPRVPAGLIAAGVLTGAGGIALGARARRTWTTPESRSQPPTLGIGHASMSRIGAKPRPTTASPRLGDSRRSASPQSWCV